VNPKEHAGIERVKRNRRKDDDGASLSGVARVFGLEDAMAPALAALDETFVGNASQPGAQGHAADAEFRAQRSFAGERLARSAGREMFPETGGDLGDERKAFGRVKHGEIRLRADRFALEHRGENQEIGREQMRNEKKRRKTCAKLQLLM
jgi:hypothetical protein